jgi:hypothetical protein
MAPVTSTASLIDRLAKLSAAYDACSMNKSYALGGKTYTRSDLPDIALEMEKIEGRLSRRANGSRLDVEFTR